MNLCKWTTNSPELKTKWTNSDLGLPPEAEAHSCDLEHLINILKGKGNTKRSVLRSPARTFDPIGFLTPFTI